MRAVSGALPGALPARSSSVRVSPSSAIPAAAAVAERAASTTVSSKPSRSWVRPSALAEPPNVSASAPRLAASSSVLP